MPESKLTIRTTQQNKTQVMITVATRNGNEQRAVNEKILSSELVSIFKKNPDALNNYEVEYECEKGKHISKVWKKGGESGDFHNPYNFVPALPRDKINNDLGDHEPKGHHAYHDNHYSGWLEVELTTATPLLIPDAAQVSTNRDEHKTFSVRVDADGVPYLPPTSIKGMLRAAYETVTNSRFGVFEKHEDRLAYRRNGKKERYLFAPKDLLPDSLHLATKYEELSPADRVFGWVNQNKDSEKGAWKGQLRIGTAQCEQGKEAIAADFGDDGVPLTILGGAKPQQTHFYVANDKQGKPLKSKTKADGYKNRKQGLRGRKIYPHHAHLAGLNDYWLQPREDRTQKPVAHKGKKYYQEYRRPTLRDKGKDKTRDNQNRSILGWIKPETKFSFKIQISNLSSVELGALLWLLSLEDNYYHRIGSAKSLGFGSVHLKIKNMELQTGQDWARFYENLSESKIAPANAEEHIQAYKKAVKEAYGKHFDNVSFIKAFKVALRGFKNGLPVHYPREEEKPSPKGENFKWFTENERKHHLALPSLESEEGLPLLNSKKRK